MRASALVVLEFFGEMIVAKVRISPLRVQFLMAHQPAHHNRIYPLS